MEQGQGQGHLTLRDARGSPQLKKKKAYKWKQLFNLLQDWQQTILNVKSSSSASWCSPCPACDDWGGRTLPSLCTLSTALFVPFWQPHSNVRTRSSAVLKHVSNAVLSKKDRALPPPRHARSFLTFRCKRCFFHKVMSSSSILPGQTFGFFTFSTKGKLLER